MSRGDDDAPDPGATVTTPAAPAPAAGAHALDEAEIAAALGGALDGPGATVDDRLTTKDLLQQIGDRTPGAVVHRPAAIVAGERRFVRWTLAGVLVACAVLLGVLWWLDPISVTGRQTRFSVVENGGVRQAKLDLMEELPSPPGVLVLGSSRSMKLNPKEIQRVSGETAFNGGVSGGTTQDIYLYARYADKLWGGKPGEARGPDDHFPHLVIGVVSDVFRFTGTAALDPRLKQFLPRSERQQHDELETAKQLLQMSTLKAGVRAVRRVVPRDGASALLHPEDAGEVDASLATTGKQRGNQRENLDARGMQLFDPGVQGDKRPLPTRIEEQMRVFVQRSFDADPNFTGVDARGLELLRRTIALANRHGDVPTLWVTPYAPGAVKYLPKEAFAARDAKYRAAIAELQKDPKLKFEFVDLADISTFGGDPQEFHDGIHMTEINTAKVIAYLQDKGLLAPERDR